MDLEADDGLPVFEDCGKTVLCHGRCSPRVCVMSVHSTRAPRHSMIPRSAKVCGERRPRRGANLRLPRDVSDTLDALEVGYPASRGVASNAPEPSQARSLSAISKLPSQRLRLRRPHRKSGAQGRLFFMPLTAQSSTSISQDDRVIDCSIVQIIPSFADRNGAGTRQAPCRPRGDPLRSLGLHPWPSSPMPLRSLPASHLLTETHICISHPYREPNKPLGTAKDTVSGAPYPASYRLASSEP